MASTFRPNPNAAILDLLTIGRKRGKKPRPGGQRPRPTAKPGNKDQSPTTTTASSVDHVHHHSSTPKAGTSQELSVTDQPGHNHETDHDDFSCEPTSSQHTAYIQANLDLLQKKCDEFHACTVEVYSAENFHRVLAGDNIQLSNICGLMYANGGGRYTTLNDECSRSERAAIRQDIGRQLTSTLVSPPDDNTKSTWRSLDRCLTDHKLSFEDPIDTACRIEKNSTFLCNDHNVHHVAEDFVNHEMEHLYCTCNAIKAQSGDKDTGSSSAFPLPLRIGVAGGVLGLLLILIIAVIVLCHRHRKMKRKLSKHRMKYLPTAPGEESAVYQEIGDRSQALEALRRARDQGNLPSDYHFLDQAPALPDRYVKNISASRSNLADARDNDPEYLEPLADPALQHNSPAHVNDAYNLSQGSRDGSGPGQGENSYDLARHPETDEAGVRSPGQFSQYDSINRGQNSSEEDGGYSSLGRRHGGRPKPAKRGEKPDKNSEEKEPLNKISEQGEGERGGAEEPKYFVLEPHASEGSPERQALVINTVV